MKSYKISKAFLTILIGISFLLPFIGLIGLTLGYNEDGFRGGGGAP
jgi:hypothetical protein